MLPIGPPAPHTFAWSNYDLYGVQFSWQSRSFVLSLNSSLCVAEQSTHKRVWSVLESLHLSTCARIWVLFNIYSYYVCATSLFSPSFTHWTSRLLTRPLRCWVSCLHLRRPLLVAFWDTFEEVAFGVIHSWLPQNSNWYLLINTKPVPVGFINFDSTWQFRQHFMLNRRYRTKN